MTEEAELLDLVTLLASLCTFSAFVANATREDQLDGDNVARVAMRIFLRQGGAILPPDVQDLTKEVIQEQLSKIAEVIGVPVAEIHRARIVLDD